jgi:hypothetical protein
MEQKITFMSKALRDSKLKYTTMEKKSLCPGAIFEII